MKSKRIMRSSVKFRWMDKDTYLQFSLWDSRRWTETGLEVYGDKKSGYHVYCPYPAQIPYDALGIDYGQRFKTRRAAREAVEKALGLEDMEQRVREEFAQVYGPDYGTGKEFSAHTRNPIPAGNG